MSMKRQIARLGSTRARD